MEVSRENSTHDCAFEAVQPTQNDGSNPDNTNRMIESFFLGPRAENSNYLLELVTKTVQIHEIGRNEYMPTDPIHTTRAIKESESFQKAQNVLNEKLQSLALRLKKYSVPFSSLRNLANMNPDPTIPAFVGYIAGMLYNQNNVCGETAPFTTGIEIEVAKKIVDMLGFPEFQSLDPEHTKDPNKIESWCHLTPGGSIGNLEGFWGARAVKFYPLAVRRALTEDRVLGAIAQEISVKTAKGDSKLIAECSAWELVNIECDEALRLTKRIYDCLLEKGAGRKSVSLEEVYKKVQTYSVQKKGILSTFEYLQSIDGDDKKITSIKNPVSFVSSSGHYSISKSVTLIGSGDESLRVVKVDTSSRMDIHDLERQLEECVKARTPVMVVVAIIGTTSESAVDPLSDILDLRVKYRKEHGLDFNIHVDAAYGAYYTTLIKPYPGRPDYDIRKHDLTAIARAFLSEHAAKQYAKIREVDTLTLDPHKTGYIPFPCGAFIQRNHLMKNLLHFQGPYASGSVIGYYGIEGSKGCGPACSAWLSHECLPLHIGGHGSLLGLVLYNAKKLYARLIDIGYQKDSQGNLVDVPFRVVALPKLPEEKKASPNSIEVERQYQSVINDIARKSDQEITRKIYEDDDFAHFFNQIGPDLSILCYHFNFKHPQTGKWNRSLAAANLFNQKLYKKMSIAWEDHQNPQPVQELPLMITKTIIPRNNHTESIYDDFLKRIDCYDGNEDQDIATDLTVLKTVMIHPFMSETTSGSFLDVVIKEFTQAAREVLVEEPSWIPRGELRD